MHSRGRSSLTKGTLQTLDKAASGSIEYVCSVHALVCRLAKAGLRDDERMVRQRARSESSS